MPFFEGSKDVTISGGEFLDIGGDYNIHDYSRHVRYNNSHNNTTTTISDSNNDSSIRHHIGMGSDILSTDDMRRIEARNRQKAMSAVDPAAMLERIEHALAVGGRPVPQRQQPSSRDSPATRKGTKAFGSLPQEETPSSQTNPPSQPLPRQNTLPIRTKAIVSGSRYKSNNPFARRLFKKTDPELPSRPPLPQSKTTDDMDVDSDVDNVDTTTP